MEKALIHWVRASFFAGFLFSVFSDSRGQSKVVSKIMGKLLEATADPALRNQRIDNMAVHIGEAEVAACVAVCEFLVVESHESQNGGV